MRWLKYVYVVAFVRLKIGAKTPRLDQASDRWCFIFYLIWNSGDGSAKESNHRVGGCRSFRGEI